MHTVLRSKAKNPPECTRTHLFKKIPFSHAPIGLSPY